MNLRYLFGFATHWVSIFIDDFLCFDFRFICRSHDPEMVDGLFGSLVSRPVVGYSWTECYTGLGWDKRTREIVFYYVASVSSANKRFNIGKMSTGF